jgi:NTE family protein
MKFLESKLNVSDITFEELFKSTNKKLTIIGTNLSKSQEVIFNYKNTPNFSVISALRISMSVPIIFTPVKYEDDFYIDGGVVNNFPINHCSKNSTIGFYIKNSNINQITSIKDIITSVISITADTINSKNIKKYKKNIIEIKYNEFIYTKFDIDKEQIEKLIKVGYDAASNFTNFF